MKKPLAKSVFQKVLVPVITGCDCQAIIQLARSIVGAGQVILAGLVQVPEGETLSAAARPVQEVRQVLKLYAQDDQIVIEGRVRAAHVLWNEVVTSVEETHPDLLLLRWPEDFEQLGVPPNGLQYPPCDVAILAGSVSGFPKTLLVPMRGGPYAELALSLSLALTQNLDVKVTSLHITSANLPAGQDAPFRGIEKVLPQFQEITQKEITTEDPFTAILEATLPYDLIIMGASLLSESPDAPIGPVAAAILRENRAGVLVVKTKRPAPASFASETVGQMAISILVDKWFAENTYHADEFSDLDALVYFKRKQGLTISLALPALNEEETVGNVIQTVKKALMDEAPLLDEIILVDSNSRDRTREIAQDLGIPVFIHQQILSPYGPRRGKGEALWKSLYVTRGDLICWIDTDIVNIEPHFVYGLIGPLLLRPEVQLVKGFYQRPLRVGEKLQAGGGGRVTELTARPMLNLLYPELSGLIQPLSGEYGGRRTALEQLPFSSGYGVEIGLLIDLLELCGLKSIAQVDLQERIHHNQTLSALSKMSFAILQTIFRRLEKRYGHSLLDEVNRTMKLIRYEPGRFSLEIEEIQELERPPMISLREYCERGTG